MNNKNVVPEVSIIMPAFNAERHIKAAVNSALSQSLKDFELIIIDDCSSDSTYDIIKQFSELDDRIKHVKNKKNYGAALSRNKALDMASGRYFAFLDADDIWDNDKLERQISFMKKHDLDFVYTNYRIIDTVGNYRATIVCPGVLNRYKMLFSNFIGNSTVVIAAAFVGEKRQRDIYCRNDYFFWLDLLVDNAKANLYPYVTCSIRKGDGISSNILVNLKWNVFVIRKSSRFGLILLPLLLPLFLIIYFFKRHFTNIYNKIIEVL